MRGESERERGEERREGERERGSKRIMDNLGGPTGLYFLNAMSADWLSKYVATFNPIAGPWTGAPNALRAVVC